ILLFYIPAKILLGIWLPEYKESLNFMGILFPIVIYEGRMSLLINTYLKTLRKEKMILMVNVLTLSLSLILSLIVIYTIGNLNLTVGIILLSLAFRCNLAEYFLCRVMGIKIISKIVLESVVTVLFIFSNIWFGGTTLSMVAYFGVYMIYLLIIHKSFLKDAKSLRLLIKKS
ncbi:hypothetical protein JZO68_15055, partial [Enterococcus sp. DIV1271a]|nr:hypothetical protein [Enterococcus sp. DIV1271a]